MGSFNCCGAEQEDLTARKKNTMVSTLAPTPKPKIQIVLEARDTETQWKSLDLPDVVTVSMHPHPLYKVVNEVTP
jgi:hypothetical protein